ncbi:nitroreductase family protein [Sporolactobacillus sp. CQH2019]|uniref:nitroreductase family protein n=1 Tax=Sporolactobacillus sp. CQH2019 TaxID=3023512 RepID=UPI00236805D5|nr:nitroreductase family protein [Sporolactobacillus sp. CQH2019]MDD9149903.1 nitroreductase family protein [Sporolactobacillus sp. CQH2019]
MSNAFLDSIKQRRSIYGLDKNAKASKQEIVATIEEAVKYVPSAFNSQTARAVILFGEENEKLWGIGGIVEQALHKVVPDDKFAPTAEKLASFNAGLGTVLFFEDTQIVKDLQEKFTLYADNFPVWSEQSTGINQFAVWTALANIGLGGSLQHYNPLIDEAVGKAFDIPENWNLRAEMPFGNITAPARDKEFAPIESRVKVWG